jgi:hypothetical protein
MGELNNFYWLGILYIIMIKVINKMQIVYTYMAGEVMVAIT